MSSVCVDCQWHMTEHSCRGIQNLNNTSNAPSPVLLYKQSVFCLSPTGDSFTRKSLFDSYLAGCIPVIFSKLTLNMYEWHLPQDDIDATSVFIPRTQVIKKKVNFMNELMKISAESIVAMQRAIELLAFRLQYSVVPEAYRQEVRDDTGNAMIIYNCVVQNKRLDNIALHQVCICEKRGGLLKRMPLM